MSKAIIFLYSYHHKNTQKIGDAIAAKINATVVDINNNVETVVLENYDLIGFGSGIDSGRHYPQMVKYVENLPDVQNKKAFLFSTIGITSEKRMAKDYAALLELLKDKGFVIMNDFNTKGFNTSSILKCISEINNENSANKVKREVK